jgi:hypothetical protein
MEAVALSKATVKEAVSAASLAVLGPLVGAARDSINALRRCSAFILQLITGKIS